jgi:hypothetical protein
VAVHFSHTAPICRKKACEKGDAPLDAQKFVAPVISPVKKPRMLNLKAFDHLTTTRDCSGGKQAGRQCAREKIKAFDRKLLLAWPQN